MQNYPQSELLAGFAMSLFFMMTFLSGVFFLFFVNNFFSSLNTWLGMISHCVFSLLTTMMWQKQCASFYQKAWNFLSISVSPANRALCFIEGLVLKKEKKAVFSCEPFQGLFQQWKNTLVKVLHSIHIQ